MRGRPPKPAAIHDLNGNPSRIDVGARAEAEPKPARGMPKRLDSLTPAGRKTWKELTAHLDAMGILAQTDGQIIAMTCDAWTTYCESRAIVMREGLLADCHGMQVPHPALSIAKSQAMILMRMLPELGLTPSGRARIAIRKVESGAGGILEWLEGSKIA